MSKRLAKIISICVIAVLIPFAVVAVALTLTQAKGVEVCIAQTGENATKNGTYSEVAIYINSKKQEESSIIVRKNSQVKVTFSGEGYRFEGWYEGNADEINAESNALSTLTAYQFSATKDTVITAVRNVQKYNIIYTGENIDIQSELVEYNTELPIPQANGGLIFAGWKIKGTETAATFVANFEVEEQNATIELEPVWKENISYTVFYSVNDQTVENSWEMVYTKNNGFAAYPKAESREGYTFQGLSIAGSDNVYIYDAGAKDYICSGEKLSEVLLRQADPVIYAVWSCVYPEITFTFEARVNEAGKEYGQSLYSNGINLKNMIATVEISDENGIDLDDSFYNYFLGEFENITTKNGEACVFNGEIRFELAGTAESYILPFIDADGNALPVEEITFRMVYETLEFSFEGADLSIGFDVDFRFDII